MILKSLYHKTRHGKMLLCSFFYFVKKKKALCFTDYLKYYLSEYLTADEYFNYRFDTCSVKFRETFLPYHLAEKYWEVLNPTKYAALARDKFIGHCLFDKIGIKSSKLYFAYNEEVIGNNQQAMICRKEDIVSYLKHEDIKKFVVKPSADSAHGLGVKVISTKDLEHFGGNRTIDSIIGGGTTLFESFIDQTEQLSQFNPSSVNTIRMMTALFPNQEVKLFAAFIKIGRKGSCIDNAGNGGNVDCAINTETGELYNAMQFNSWEDYFSIEKHPDSGVQLNGIKINNWDSIKKQVMAWQAQIPYLKTIGWDVAVTKEGPVIIEINNWWDTTGQLFIGEGWKQQVKECYEAWVNHYNQQK